MIVVCNGDEAKNIMPALIFASSGLAVDHEVHVFFCPAGAKWALKGELEKLGEPKGLANPVQLFDDILELGGRVVLCELARKNKDIDPQDLRDGRILIDWRGAQGCSAGTQFHPKFMFQHLYMVAY